MTTTTATVTTSEPATTSSTTTTTAAAPATTAPPTVAVDPFAVAFPAPGTRRYATPEEAGVAYASEVLGFTDLVAGEYRQGDARSGEMPVTDRPGGPETTISVRVMDDGSWYALGSHTPDITVGTPAYQAAVSTPMRTTGDALAFEGTVNVEIRSQGGTVLGEGFVTGHGSPPPGPFDGTVDFDVPADGTPGVVVYREYSTEDGHVRKATSFPVRLAR